MQWKRNVKNEAVNSYLLTLESYYDRLSFQVVGLPDTEVTNVLAETGTPVGFHALIAGYDAVPELPVETDQPSLPEEVLIYLATHERIRPEARDLARLKANLRTLYEAGLGAKDVEQDRDEDESSEDEDAIGSGSHIPVPTETFLEELSQKLQIHPVSVYWLLEELRAEGVRCKPEEQRVLEERLSVLVLHLLGHRWPKQIEAGDRMPEWADADGVIPLMAGTGEQILTERVRARLRAEDSELGAQKTEALLQEYNDPRNSDHELRWMPRC